MKKVISILLIVIVLIVAAVIFALPLFVSNSDIQDYLTSQIKARAGDQFEIGEIGVGFIPSAFIEVSNVVVYSPKSSKEIPVLKAKKAKVFLKLFPLIFKNIEASSVQMKGVDVYYEWVEKGKKAFIQLTDVEGRVKSVDFKTPSRFSFEGHLFETDSTFEVEGDAFLSLDEGKFEFNEMSMRYDVSQLDWAVLVKSGLIRTSLPIRSLMLGSQGVVSFNSTSQDVNGTSILTFQDLDYGEGKLNTIKTVVEGEVVESLPFSIPLKFETDYSWTQANQTFQMDNMNITGLGLEGVSFGSVSMSEQPQIDFTLRIRDLNLNEFIPQLPSNLLAEIGYLSNWTAEGNAAASVIVKGPADNLAVSLDVDLKEALLEVPQVLKKKSGQSFSASLQSKIASEELEDVEFNIRFGSMNVKGTSARLSLETLEGDVNFISNKFPLSDFDGVFVPMKGLTLEGEAKLLATLKGKLTDFKQSKYGTHTILDSVTLSSGDKVLVRHLSGSFDFNSDRIAFQEVLLKLNDTDLKMNLALNDPLAPQFEMDIQSDKFVVDDFISLIDTVKEIQNPTIAQAQTQAIKTARSSFWERTAYAEEASSLISFDSLLASPDSSRVTNSLPEPLRKATGNINISLKEVLFQGISLTDLKGVIQFDNGKADIQTLKIRAGQGSVEVVGKASFDSLPPRYVLKLDSVNVPMEILFQKFEKKIMSGLLNASLNVQGEIGGRDQLEETIIGQGAFDISNGEIYGVNLLGAFSTLPELVSFNLSDPLVKFTSFRNLKGRIQIADRKVKFADTYLLSNKLYVTSEGIVDFDENIDFHSKAQLGEISEFELQQTPSETNAVVVPFRLSGTISDPKVSVDKRAIGRAIISKIGSIFSGGSEDSSMQDTVDQASKIISSIFG